MQPCIYYLYASVRMRKRGIRLCVSVQSATAAQGSISASKSF